MKRARLAIGRLLGNRDAVGHSHLVTALNIFQRATAVYFVQEAKACLQNA